MRGAWAGLRYAWVSDDRRDARFLLAGEPVSFAYGPTTRSVKNLVRNAVLAVRIVRRQRPAVILTTGAALSVPFAWVGRAFGARVVYVESLSRISAPSVSCRLVAPVAERVYVQWPELQQAVPRSRYAGSVVGTL
jgi:UDP-N-acetylglucosamine:LPS N-acetylglucosamine transferase